MMTTLVHKPPRTISPQEPFYALFTLQKGLSWGLGFCTPHFRILFSTFSKFVVQGCFACFGRPSLQSYTGKTSKP